MSTPMLTSFVSNNNETPTKKKQAANRINSAPIRTLTTTTKFSSTSFNNLKQQQNQAKENQIENPLERFTVDYVIKRGYFNLVRYLLGLGLDPNHVSFKDSYPHMYTSLIYCTFVKDEKWAISLAQNLLEHGADLKQTDSNLLNPIHYCCAFGLENLLRLFLKSVDFDLSKALDANGNNCMHYAIRSHNLNCVKLIIEKFKPNDMYKKIDVKNALGLKPSQIEDEVDFSQMKYFNYKFNGVDSLDECKQELTDFIREYTILRTIIIYKPKLESKPSDLKKEDLLKTKTSKSKKRTGKQKSKKNSRSSSAGSDKSEFKGNFFQTEIEPIIEETKPSTAATSPKSKKKSSKSSKKNEPLEETELKIEPLIQQQPEVVIPPPQAPAPVEEKPLDKEKAKQLTSKSFKINLRDRLNNLIGFNELFVSKEHMFKSVLNASGSETHNFKLHRSSSLKPDLSRIIDDKFEMVASTAAAASEPVKTWKTHLPNMFLNLECSLTPSYRETVQPTSSSTNFFKKSLKKSSRKSLSSNLDASFSRPNSILKRQSSALKGDRKNSLIQKISEGSANQN